MTTRAITMATTAGLLALAAAPVRADENASDEPIVVAPIDVRADDETSGPEDPDDDTAARDARRALDEPAFVTVVHVDEHAGETTTVAEVLAESVGVRARSLGGLGSFASISVRGADSGHTTVLIDGVPLSRIASVTADLGRFSLNGFNTIELYRGGVPIEYGGAAIGGAVNLRTDFDGEPGVELGVGAGSFGARHATARWLGRSDNRRHSWHLRGGYRGSTGDYSFYDDNGTNLNFTDDTVSERANNDFDQVDVSGRHRLVEGPWQLESGARFLWKNQGIPGPDNAQTEQTNLETASWLGDARAHKMGWLGQSSLSARASAFAYAEQQHYRDPMNEVGLGVQDDRYRTLSAGSSLGAAWTGAPAQQWSLGADIRIDYFDQDDVSGTTPMQETLGLRTAAALSFADDISLGGGDRFVLQPSIRLDVQHTEPLDDHVASNIGTGELAARTDVHPTPRVAARARVVDAVSVKGSAGWYFRAPTVYELFGDRGFIIGNGDLEPETGASADLGLVYAPMKAIGPLDRIYVETAGFLVRPRDAIVFVPVAGMVARATNLDDARIRGGEAVATARLARRVTVTANYTHLDTEQQSSQSSFDGKEMPHRPAHELYGRVDVAARAWSRELAVWGDASYTSGNFLDRGNFSQVPARTLLGAGVKVEVVSRVLVSLELKNLLDQRTEDIPLEPPPRPDLTSVPQPISDFLGYPLPGRAAYLSLQWTP